MHFSLKNHPIIPNYHLVMINSLSSGYTVQPSGDGTSKRGWVKWLHSELNSLLLILVEKREGERGEVWHLGGGCGLPETREEQCRPLPPQAQLDVPSCLPQIPEVERKLRESKIWRVRVGE